MVGVTAQVVLPEALLPKAEPVHLLVVVAERRVRQRCTLQSSQSTLKARKNPEVCLLGLGHY